MSGSFSNAEDYIIGKWSYLVLIAQTNSQEKQTTNKSRKPILDKYLEDV